MLEIIATAVLTAAATVTTAWFVGRHYLVQIIEPRVQTIIDQRFAEAGDIIEARVRNGVVNAVAELSSPEHLQKQMGLSSDSLMKSLFGKPFSP